MCRDLDLPPGKGYLVKTWEVALTEHIAPTVLIDEAGKYPPVLDLLLLCKPGIRNVFFTSGPGQGKFDLPLDCPGASYLTPTATLLLPGACKYFDESFRTPIDTGSEMNLRTRSLKRGSIRFNRPSHGPILTTTAGAAAALSGLGRKANSMDSCQGGTFPGPTTVLLDSFARDMDNCSIYTALTRCTGDTHVVESNGKPANFLLSSSSIVRALGTFAITGDSTELQRAVTQHRAAHIPPHLSDPLNQPGVEPPPLRDLLYDSLNGTGFGDFIYNYLAWLVPPPIKKYFSSDWYIAKDTYDYDHAVEVIESVDNLNLHYTPLPNCIRPEGFVRSDNHQTNRGSELLFTLIDDYKLHNPHLLIEQPELCSDIIESLYPECPVYHREIKHSGVLTQQVNTEDYATAVFLRHRRTDTATENWTFKERYTPPIPLRPLILVQGFLYSPPTSTPIIPKFLSSPK